MIACLAQSFSANPEKYLTSIGIPSNALDINSLEVKAILALGDKDVKERILNNDLAGFVKLLDTKGYLSWNKMLSPKGDLDNLQINDKLQDFLIQSFKDTPELQEYIKSFESLANATTNSKTAVEAVVVAIAIAYVLVLVHSQVGVSYNVAVALNVAAAVNVVAKVNVKVSGEVASTLVTANPVLKIYGLETQTNDTYVVNAYVEQTLNQIVDVSKQVVGSNVISDQDLKSALRVPVTQKMIDLGMF